MPTGLFTDFYELTMAAGYSDHGMADERAVFDLFFRDVPDSVDLAIFAGLEPVLEFLADWGFSDEDVSYLRSVGSFPEPFLRRLADVRFTGSLCAVPEGTPVFPYEPILRVEAPLLEAQLIETALINRVAHSSLIASHAAQIVACANGKSVLEFGARRAHGPDGALSGSRAAIIGGCSATSLTATGKRDGAPVSGTQAHSWVMAFEHELEAFRAYAATFPDECVLLVDTYDTLRSGVPNALTVAAELRRDGHELSGIRLDSGDLGALAVRSRTMLDEAGFPDVRILASGDLNAARIRDLEAADAPIDAYGVGTELAVAKPDPAFTAVYKLAAIGDRPTLKLSSTPAKITDPGVKQLWRREECDVIGLASEDLPGRRLLEPALTDGRRVRDPEPLSALAERCRTESSEVRGRDWKVRRSDALKALRADLTARYTKNGSEDVDGRPEGRPSDEMKRD